MTGSGGRHPNRGQPAGRRLSGDIRLRHKRGSGGWTLAAVQHGNREQIDNARQVVRPEPGGGTAWRLTWFCWEAGSGRAALPLACRRQLSV